MRLLVAGHLLDQGLPGRHDHLLLRVLGQNVSLGHDAQYEGILAVGELAWPIWK